MMHLHSDWAYLAEEFGCSVPERFLMAVRSLDNPKAVTPFLVEREGRRFGLFMHVEKGNVEAAGLPSDIQPIYYRPYFTFESAERPPHVALTLADALEIIADGDRRIVIDWHTPVVIASQLSARFYTETAPVPAFGPVTLRKANCTDTLERLGRGRLEAAHVARRLLSESPVRERLLPYLDQHADERFAALDEAVEKAKLAGLIVSSTLNVQEIAGVPVGRKDRPLAAIYVPGERHAWVIELGNASDGEVFATPEAALQAAMPNGEIGVEVEDLSLGLAEALGLDTRDHKPADTIIRQWRDENTLPDLAYYVIATRTTRNAIDAALAFAASAIRRNIGITEMDPYAVYLRTMREFVAANMSGASVSRTLTNFHTGARTIFPANAAPFPLNADANTLKVDSGCLLFDGEGILLGCSDIARTLALSDEGVELYDVIQRTVRHTLIPKTAAGRTGDAIHSDGVDQIWSLQERLSTNSLFVKLKSPHQEYTRDVGHLLGKNNLAHLSFAKGENTQLREGMIACCEFQWPLNHNAIAYEDTCLVTSSGGLNLTSDED
jgi:Xaa-Pro aminopeptidase